MFFNELETDRLFLKNISMYDREFILEQFSNIEVNRYLFDAEPLIDILGADEIIDFYVQPKPRAQHRWILVRKSDGTKIGTCGFHCWDKLNGCCDIGYDLYPDYWGKGYMGEALRAICAFARSNMKLRSINAGISVNNEKSIKLAEKLGFTFNGSIKNGNFRGEAYPHKIFVLSGLL
jgi:Acetyltransferases, including N-acetylases of ribosomal proteins